MGSIARVAAGLAITELELATMAYVLCAIIIYGLWWNKPFNVERPLVVIIGTNLPDEMKQAWKSALLLRSKEFLMDTPLLYALTLLNPGGPRHTKKVAAAVYTTALVFSAVHLCAWNWEFPDAEAQFLWRVFASIACGASVFCMYSMYSMYTMGKKPFGSDNFEKAMVCLSCGRWDDLQWMPFLASCLAYVVSRLGLLGLTFYCFSAMPASVYEPLEWTRFLPHFHEVLLACFR